MTLFRLFLRLSVTDYARGRDGVNNYEHDTDSTTLPLKAFPDLTKNAYESSLTSSRSSDTATGFNGWDWRQL